MIHACELCKYKNECMFRPTSNVADCNIFVKEEPQTNADRIRSMSDEELAEWLFKHDTITYCHGRLNTEELLQWLKSEAKE